MPSRPRRPLVLLLLLALAASVLAACGAGEATVAPASSSTDARTLLHDTFAGGGRMKSAMVDATLRVEPRGRNAAGGPATLRLSGPFKSQGAGRVPEFQYTVAADGDRTRLQAGLTWTGGHAYVAYEGAQYEVPALLARQFEAGYEEAVKGQGGGGPAASLGVDPSRWVRDPQNAGEATVGGTDTIKVTGEADVARALGDVQRLAARARALNLPGTSGLGAGLTPEQRRTAIDSVKRLSVQVYTGKADRLLRRLVLRGDVADAHSGRTAALVLDLTLSGVNEDQRIAAPQGARPFSELVSKLGGLRALLGP